MPGKETKPRTAAKPKSKVKAVAKRKRVKPAKEERRSPAIPKAGAKKLAAVGTGEAALQQAPLEVELVDCPHCDATGKCAAGQPYDRTHHQGVFGRVRLTSCFDCLDAAGESRNSKKLVKCRICNGMGKVSKEVALTHRPI